MAGGPGSIGGDYAGGGDATGAGPGPIGGDYGGRGAGNVVPAVWCGTGSGRC